MRRSSIIGTNYYIDYEQEHDCPTCGQYIETKGLQLGKSSCGWSFSLRVYPEKGLNNEKDILEYISKEDKIIHNEYGEIVPLDEFISIMCDRGRKEKPEKWDDMIEWNFSSFSYNRDRDDIMSPNYRPKYDPNTSYKDDKYYLMRHVVDGEHCVGKSEEYPIDYILGEFS